MVIDTDGSAFITKAEFDSLKNNFQSQIDSYNSAIDSKIDGAIAAYLSGVQISKQNLLTNLYAGCGNDVLFAKTSWLVAPSKKSFFNILMNMFMMRDGYYENGSHPDITAWRLFQFSIDHSSVTMASAFPAGTGTYLVGSHSVAGLPLVTGFVTDEYIGSYYVFTGCAIGFQGENTQDTSTTLNKTIYLNTNSRLSNKVEVHAASERETIYSAASPQEWCTYTPKTSGWGAKTTYWARYDTYNNGTISTKNAQLACKLNGNEIGMIDIEHREVSENNPTVYLYPGSELNSCTLSNSTNVATMLMNAIQKVGVENYNLRYFFPKVYKHSDTDLLNSTVSLASGINVKLTDGIPLFRTDAQDGVVRFSFKAVGDSTFGFKNAAFNNINGVTDANVEFKICPNTTIYNSSTATTATTYSLQNGKNYAVEIDIDPSKTYYFKCNPTSSDAGISYSDFSDIVLETM